MTSGLGRGDVKRVRRERSAHGFCVDMRATAGSMLFRLQDEDPCTLAEDKPVAVRVERT